MKKNLVYILTLITIVVALNYMHIHSDPYPDCHNTQDPFFANWLQESTDTHTIATMHAEHQEYGNQSLLQDIDRQEQAS